MSVIHSWFQETAIKKQANLLKKTYFAYVFDSFPLFLCAQVQIAPIALRSVALFLRVTGAIHSYHSLKKSDHEKIAPVALYKRPLMTKAILSFS